MNLLKETLDIIHANGFTEKDVEWVGNDEFHFSFEHFKKIANVKYDSGFGAQEVAIDLVIVGKDWWMERHEYDGSEWWEFKSIIKKPEKYKQVDKVVGGKWDSLSDINE